MEFTPIITRFLEESTGKDVVYVSFGSYVKMSDVTWYTQLVDILIDLDLRIILKVDKLYEKRFPESVLSLSWAPQKDLLKSGKVKLFISHCGNNGRLATIFYNVPVLCIPLFADQPLCAEIITLNGFGESLLKEEIAARAKDLVTTMINNHGSYYEKMKKASDVVENEPGNVRENLVFFVEQVAKFGNVDYLVNKVIKQQTAVQIHNLDVIIPVCVVCITVVGFILCVLHKLLKYCSIKSVFRSTKDKLV
jgi:UDP:flavonoid glycosyltransferase YjiC (YdhE family)